MSTTQKEVIIGNLLGDGYMYRKKITHNPVLKIDQTYPEHSRYVNHLYNIYRSITLSPPRISVRKPDIRTDKIYSTIRFRTRALPCLVPFYELFYKTNEKGNYV